MLPRVGTLKLLALSLYSRTVQTIVNIGEIFLLEIHLATTLQDEHSVCTFSSLYFSSPFNRFCI